MCVKVSALINIIVTIYWTCLCLLVDRLPELEIKNETNIEVNID